MSIAASQYAAWLLRGLAATRRRCGKLWGKAFLAAHVARGSEATSGSHPSTISRDFMDGMSVLSILSIKSWDFMDGMLHFFNPSINSGLFMDGMFKDSWMGCPF